MRRRTSLPILQHTYGINSLELKTKLASAASDSAEHVDLLLTRVKGIKWREIIIKMIQYCEGAWALRCPGTHSKFC